MSAGDSDEPAVLIAHSLGCHLAAAWAAHSNHASRVRAALLVAPPDTETPLNLFAWRPIVRALLPFASRVVIRSHDYFCTPDRAAEMARDWGSEAVHLGACGHINGASGLGDWRQGLALLRTLLA